MKNLAVIVVAVCLVPLSAPAHAIFPQSIVRRNVDNQVCSRIETPLVSTLVYDRDHGATREATMEKIQRLSNEDGGRTVAEYRVDDVYLDSAITVDTLVSYRTARCAANAMQQDYTPFRDDTRTGLLACQALGKPGDRKFGGCIHALLDTLESRRGHP